MTPLTREQHLYWKLAEEAAEVIQEASKASIFGPEEAMARSPTNRQRVILELNDLFAVCEMLGLHQVDRAHIAEKKLKVEKWLAYADSMGMLKG